MDMAIRGASCFHGLQGQGTVTLQEASNLIFLHREARPALLGPKSPRPDPGLLAAQSGQRRADRKAPELASLLFFQEACSYSGSALRGHGAPGPAFSVLNSQPGTCRKDWVVASRGSYHQVTDMRRPGCTGRARGGGGLGGAQPGSSGASAPPCWPRTGL